MRELPEMAGALGLKPYAARQLAGWLYGKMGRSFEEMTDLSKEARRLLAQRYSVSAVRTADRLAAPDGTTKLLLEGAAGGRFECVLIPAEEGRTTACISTQVGCAMGCSFCRTADMGLVRDLTLGEITGQLIELSRESPAPITNLVFMGMGEPLNNMEAVLDAIEIFLDGGCFGLSKRRITLSTSGLIPKLEEFARRADVKIAISLNATTDEVRDRIMPVNRQSPIAEIMRFAREYGASHRNRVTFEYVMLRGVNDAREDAARLAKLLGGIRAKVNLIPFNPYEGSPYDAPLAETVEWWSDFLRRAGLQANVRASRGGEILAACGQLASKAEARS